MEFDEDILEDLFAILGVIRISIDIVKDPLLVAAEELLEGPFVPFLVVGHQRFIIDGWIKHGSLRENRLLKSFDFFNHVFHAAPPPFF